MAAAVAFFLFLGASISAAAAQQRYLNISVGSSLTPHTNSAWLSSSGIFAFGFYETPDGNAVCIFFASFKERTVVWTANSEDPIVPDNLALLLTKDGLVLQESDSQSVFSRIDNSSQPIAWASMLDNGNFVLCNSDGSVVWQSFDHPTDSFLPGQPLLSGGMLLSRASETDLKTGIFRLWMQLDANLVMYYIYGLDGPGDSYYSFSTYDIGKNVSLNLENDGRLYLFDGSSELLDLTKGGNPVVGTIYLARLDWDGIFRLYNRSLHKEDDWISIWSATDDKCLPKGLCGVNSFCRFQYSNADCKCIPGFGLVQSGQWSAGCTNNFMVDCADKDQSSKYEMTSILNVTWEDNYYGASRGMTEERCKQGCLEDCNCIVALFKDGECRKQKLPLSYGRWSAEVPDMAFVRVIKSSVNPGKNVESWPHSDIHIIGSLLVALAISEYYITAEAFLMFVVAIFLSGIRPPSGHKRRHPDLQKHVIIGVSVGIVISTIIIYYITRICGWRNQGKENKQNVDKFLLKHGSLAPKQYSYKEIKKITKSFTGKLGQGGYGIVYKGKLPDGQLVAVKVLKKTHDNAEEFINEVASISRTSHVNIVNLLGFCYATNKRALVYEFMHNQSLDKFIYKSRSADPDCSLEWKKLYEIAVGVARGLEYLHRGCNTRIVHFDIKPQNILLDEDFCPKISDFGLAKLCVKKQSVISMLGTRGTIGYIAPEVFSRNFGLVSHKSDVYSYGIMLLQMAETRTNVETKPIQSSENFFLERIYEHVLVQNEKIYALMTEEEEDAVRKMLTVGFWCIQTAPLDRPSMNIVVDMLEGDMQSIQIPPMPFLLSSPRPQDSCLLPVIVETPNSTGSYC